MTGNSRNALVGIGQSLGTGLTAALQGLTARKVADIENKRKAEMWESIGVNPEFSRFITQQPETVQRDIIGRISGLNIGDNLGDIKTEERENKQQAAKNKYNAHYEETLLPLVNVYDQIIDTGEDMLRKLDKGVQTGVLAGKAAHYAPSWLNENTELFNKDAATLLNLSTEGMKGVPSKLRIQWQEAEKPGVKHSEGANRELVMKKIREAKAKRNQVYKRFPHLKELSLFAEEGKEQPMEESRQSLDAFSAGPHGEVARDKLTGKVYRWNPTSQDYDIEVK